MYSTDWFAITMEDWWRLPLRERAEAAGEFAARATTDDMTTFILALMPYPVFTETFLLKRGTLPCREAFRRTLAFHAQKPVRVLSKPVKTHMPVLSKLSRALYVEAAILGHINKHGLFSLDDLEEAMGRPPSQEDVSMAVKYLASLDDNQIRELFTHDELKQGSETSLNESRVIDNARSK